MTDTMIDSCDCNKSMIDCVIAVNDELVNDSAEACANCHWHRHASK